MRIQDNASFDQANVFGLGQANERLEPVDDKTYNGLE